MARSRSNAAARSRATFKRATMSPPRRPARASRSERSAECVLDPCPVIERAFLARGDRDHQLVPPGGAQGFDALRQFLFGGGEGRATDQFGGDEAALLGLDENKMPAVVLQIARIGWLEMP